MNKHFVVSNALSLMDAVLCDLGRRTLASFLCFKLLGCSLLLWYELHACRSVATKIKDQVRKRIKYPPPRTVTTNLKTAGLLGSSDPPHEHIISSAARYNFANPSLPSSDAV